MFEHKIFNLMLFSLKRVLFSLVLLCFVMVLNSCGKKEKKISAKDLKEIADFDAAEGWQWVPLHTGGILTVKHATGREVTIYK